MTVLPVVLATCSAVLFALGSSMQHRAVGSSNPAKRHLVQDLLIRPGWLIGAGLCATAFLLHALALSRGDITLVQPIILSGIVFAVLARPLIDHRLPAPAETGWAAVTWSGLAVFVLTLRPGAPRHAPDNSALLLLFGTALAAVGLLMLVARVTRGRPVLRGAALALAAGLLYGLVAGLLKLTTTTIATHGIGAVVVSWPPWTLGAIGGVAVLTNQRAYQSTRLSVTAPLLNIAQLLISMSFGVVVLGEQPLIREPTNVVGTAGLLLMLLGVIRLNVHATKTHSPNSRTKDERPAQGVQPNTSDSIRPRR